MSARVELAWSTPAAWADAALADPHALLSDHAHCELGAAASAQGLIARAPGNEALVDFAAGMAVEEMRHFRQVHRRLRELGGELQRVRRNRYVAELIALGRGERERGLLDRLLIAALVERRSLERFELLARAGDPRLSPLYAELAPSEAGHARRFVELAEGQFGVAEVGARLAQLAVREGEIVRMLPFGPRIHSGPPIPTGELQLGVDRSETPPEPAGSHGR